MTRTKVWLYGAGAGALVLLLSAWAFAPRPVEVETAPAAQGHFETTVDEDAKTRLRNRYVVSAPLAAQLMRQELREGDTVAAGAVVAVLRPLLSPMLDERTLHEQQVRVETAEAQVQRAEARIETLQVTLRRALDDLGHSEQLATQGFVSESKLRADRLAVLAARKELKTGQEERHVALHEADLARAALAAVRRADRKERDFVLRAPAGGRVLRVLQPSETTVALGTPLLELGDTADMEVVAELLTTDALQARPGSRVTIERWGGTPALQGSVRLVEPAAFTKVSALGVEEQRVKVLIDIDSPVDQWQTLGDGYRVSVRIVTLATDDAVQVPVGAVFPLPGPPEGPGGMGVFVLRDGRARLTPVQIGARNATQAWIHSDVAPGDRVLVYPPAAVADGSRVSVRKVQP